MIKNCPMRHENGNCIPAGGFCTANKNICEALLNAYRMGKTQLSKESTTSVLISRQAAIDAVEKNACNTQRIMDAVNNLPPAQPEPTDISAKEAVYNLAEKIGIHQLFALTVELRGEPIQPEPKEGHWIEGGIYRDVIECNCSECGQLMTTAATVRMNYCPNCGAKMKGAEHETD